MKIVTTNLLNRFWKNGVKPIRDALANKFDKAKLSNNMLTTEPGFAMDARQGPVIMEKLNKLQTEVNSTNSNLKYSICDSGIIKNISVPPGSNGASATAVFSTAMDKSPVVICQPTQLGAYMGVGVNVTNTGFTVTILNNYTSNLTVDLAWIAIKK